MQDALALFPYVIALVSVLAGVMAWVQTIRFSNEYRAATEQAMKAKDAQIAQMQEIVNAKEATIENLRNLTYAEAARHLTAQKELYEQRGADLTQTLAQAAEGRLLSEQQVARLREELAEVNRRTVDVSRIADSLESLARGTGKTEAGLDAFLDAYANGLIGSIGFVQIPGRSPRGDTGQS